MLEALREEMVRSGWPEPSKRDGELSGYWYSWVGAKTCISMWLTSEGKLTVVYAGRFCWPQNVGEASYVLDKWRTMLMPGEIPALDNAPGCSAEPSPPRRGYCGPAPSHTEIPEMKPQCDRYDPCTCNSGCAEVIKGHAEEGGIRKCGKPVWRHTAFCVLHQKPRSSPGPIRRVEIDGVIIVGPDA